MLLQLRHFWDAFQTKLADENFYTASIGEMRLRLAKLQESDKKARTIGAEGMDRYKDVDGVLYHQRLLFVLEIIRTELIRWHHDDSLEGHFGIDKTRELIGRKYYWPSLRKNVEAYVKGCNICLALKAVRHKPYGDLQALPVPIHRWKDLSMDFVTELPVSTDWKGKSYDFILVIVNRLTKMVHYEPVKVTIVGAGCVYSLIVA